MTKGDRGQKGHCLPLAQGTHWDISGTSTLTSWPFPPGRGPALGVSTSFDNLIKLFMSRAFHQARARPDSSMGDFRLWGPDDTEGSSSWQAYGPHAPWALPPAGQFQGATSGGGQGTISLHTVWGPCGFHPAPLHGSTYNGVTPQILEL